MQTFSLSLFFQAVLPKNGMSYTILPQIVVIGCGILERKIALTELVDCLKREKYVLYREIKLCL